MHANVEDRGIKGECTPLMEAASAGHLDIVRLLVAHGADVNAQSSSGIIPVKYYLKNILLPICRQHAFDVWMCGWSPGSSEVSIGKWCQC